MKIVLEATDVTDDLLISIYEANVKIIDVKRSPNGWTDLYLEGTEANLLVIYIAFWCEPSVKEAIKDFQAHVIE